MGSNANAVHREPWNKGKIVGLKAPFKLKDIWAIRVRLQMESRVRELALFNLGIDSKLRGCDLVSLKVQDICHGDQVATRAVVMQHNTQRPVQFEISPATRDVVQKWIKQAGLKSDDFVFPSRIQNSPHLGMQYARILGGWIEELGLDPAEYGTHSMRRTKATLIYGCTKNPRAVQLLGHATLESTVRYLGIEVDDALEEVSEQDRDLIEAHWGCPVVEPKKGRPGGLSCDALGPRGSFQARPGTDSTRHVRTIKTGRRTGAFTQGTDHLELRRFMLGSGSDI